VSLLKSYDIVYKSKVFTYTPDYPYQIDVKKVIKGGTGYKNYSIVLPEEVEHIAPDNNSTLFIL